MAKTILLTGATDGIGLATAHRLAELGEHLIIHGRNTDKLTQLKAQIEAEHNIEIDTVCADLSVLSDVAELVEQLKLKYKVIDIIINNAGVFKTDKAVTPDGLDIRFAVNTLAPYIISKGLLDIMPAGSRIINLSSAAQASVDFDALKGKKTLNASQAYAQSKLAITQWSIALAKPLQAKGVVVIAVNPGSLLATKMVKEGYGIAGGDIQIGAKVLTHLALDGSFSEHSGQYFDNDSGQFANPHQDAMDMTSNKVLVEQIETIITAVFESYD